MVKPIYSFLRIKSIQTIQNKHPTTSDGNQYCSFECRCERYWLFNAIGQIMWKANVFVAPFTLQLQCILPRFSGSAHGIRTVSLRLEYSDVFEQCLSTHQSFPFILSRFFFPNTVLLHIYLQRDNFKITEETKNICKSKHIGHIKEYCYEHMICCIALWLVRVFYQKDIRYYLKRLMRSDSRR